MSLERILCVDDEPNILAGYQRILRKSAEISVAASGAQALAMLAELKPAVVMADRHMPGMDGIELLQKISVAYPDIIRVMVTGANDQETAIAAINHGHIFRFLSKPVQGELLIRTVEDALRQWHLIHAERDLLERTLNGGVQVLVDILGLVDPAVAGHGESMRQDLRQLCQVAKVDAWQVELAAMLAPVGRVALPPAVMAKAGQGEVLDAIEADMVQRVPEVGSMLIANIPRLEEAARIILYQDKQYDGGGFPADSTRGENIPLGARILFLVSRMRANEREGLDRPAALARMAATPGFVDPGLLQAAMQCWCGVAHAGELKPHRLRTLAGWRELQPGMELKTALMTKDGSLLLGVGQTITRAHLERFANFARMTELTAEPLSVLEPMVVTPVTPGRKP
jgi:response regulator RpfG family c-di-GMP phosphodiesterase